MLLFTLERSISTHESNHREMSPADLALGLRDERDALAALESEGENVAEEFEFESESEYEYESDSEYSSLYGEDVIDDSP